MDFPLTERQPCDGTPDTATCFCVSPWHTGRMYTALSSYALVGIDAVPVNVNVDGDRVRVVDPQNGLVYHSVRLESIGSELSVVAHVVNVRTSPLRKRAPARISAGKVNVFIA
jgi:hypothetical protein